MSKRVYLPEIKRLITRRGDFLAICKAVDNHNSEIPCFIARFPFPENCRRYEVRYRQSKNGKYEVSNSPYNCEAVYENGVFVQLACFIPKSWHGKKFNRYVKVVY